MSVPHLRALPDICKCLRRMRQMCGGPDKHDCQLLGKRERDGDLVSFQGGRSHNDAQVGAAPLHLLQQPKQRVCGQAALMRLIHHHHTAAPSFWNQSLV